MTERYFHKRLGIDLRLGRWQDVLADVQDVDLLFTSPPYNLKGGSNRNTKTDKCLSNGPQYADDLPEDVYQQQQHDALKTWMQMCAGAGVIAYNAKNRHRHGQILSPWSWFPTGLVVHDEVVLDRGSSHNHEPSFLQPTTERLYIIKRTAGTRFWFDKRGQRDLWTMPIKKRSDWNAWHSAPFALSFAEQVVKTYCKPNGLVCDPYSGSGTVAMACIRTGRRFVGSEADPDYFERSMAGIMDAVSHPYPAPVQS